MCLSLRLYVKSFLGKLDSSLACKTSFLSERNCLKAGSCIEMSLFLEKSKTFSRRRFSRLSLKCEVLMVVS